MEEKGQSSMEDEVKGRLQKAAAELEEKYASGNGGQDTSVTGPTGAAYAEKRAAEQARKKALKQQSQRENENTHSSNIDLDDEEGSDEDNELRNLRDARIRELRNAHKEKLENVGKGHGQYKEIVQDEFLKEVTASLRVICHFYHRDFPRCAIMDHHLSKLAPRHIETKFVKIDAEKAPFFVEKLTIRSIPTLVLFVDGVAKEKVLGFEGLSDLMPAGKEDEWPTVTLARLLAAKGIINADNIIDEQEIESSQRAKLEELRRKVIKETTIVSLEDDDDDFTL